MIATIFLVVFQCNMSRCAYARHDNMSRCMLTMKAVLDWWCAGRPGIDLSQEPPAVRMNDELGGILTYKLKVIWDQTSVSPVVGQIPPSLLSNQLECLESMCLIVCCRLSHLLMHSSSVTAGVDLKQARLPISSTAWTGKSIAEQASHLCIHPSEAYPPHSFCATTGLNRYHVLSAAG